jgi:hypothetical protein
MFLSFFQEQATDCNSCNSLSAVVNESIPPAFGRFPPFEIYLPYVLLRTGEAKWKFPMFFV